MGLVMVVPLGLAALSSRIHKGVNTVLTYQMQFNAKVEAINLAQRQLVVEYFDPHGGESIRVALCKFDATLDDLRQLVIDSTPHTRFHDRNEEVKATKERNIDLQQLEVIVGEDMEYNLPTYDNEVI
jgi:hypothetical protein